MVVFYSNNISDPKRLHSKHRNIVSAMSLLSLIVILRKIAFWVTTSPETQLCCHPLKTLFTIPYNNVKLEKFSSSTKSKIVELEEVLYTIDILIYSKHWVVEK